MPFKKHNLSQKWQPQKYTFRILYAVDSEPAKSKTTVTAQTALQAQQLVRQRFAPAYVTIYNTRLVTDQETQPKTLKEIFDEQIARNT